MVGDALKKIDPNSSSNNGPPPGGPSIIITKPPDDSRHLKNIHEEFKDEDRQQT
jgi:hypothetical protein